MGLNTPIKLTLYNPATDEAIKTYSRSFIPWAILKKAVRLQKLLDADDLTEDDMDQLAGLVVAVFGDQFGVEDLNNGADLGEMITVLTNIISRASVFVEGKNPTRPAA